VHQLVNKKLRQYQDARYECEINTSCCLYRVEPPNDEQQACSKHVLLLNKLIENSASCWLIL